MHKWYVLQVISALEKRIKRTLEEGREKRGFSKELEEVLLPLEKISEIKKGERRVVEKKLWPGYLILKVEMSDELWSYVKSVDGVIGFLGGAKPQALSQRELDDILYDLKEKEVVVKDKYQFSIGDQVKITDGVFVNIEGSVVEVNSDKGRLSVEVTIFGRNTRVDNLELWQVEATSEERGN